MTRAQLSAAIQWLRHIRDFHAGQLGAKEHGGLLLDIAQKRLESIPLTKVVFTVWYRHPATGVPMMHQFDAATDAERYAERERLAGAEFVHVTEHQVRA